MDGWNEIVELSLGKLEEEEDCEVAEAIIAYASLQCPPALHPHLRRIFELAPNDSTYYAEWPWRESETQELEFLRSVVCDENRSLDDRYRAWRAMLETRNSQVLHVARELWNETQISEVRRDLSFDEFVQHVGLVADGVEFSRLFTETSWHILFPEGYLPTEHAPWLQRLHPTWNPGPADVASVRFGGAGRGECPCCGQPLHHLLTLEENLDAHGISGLKSVSLETCMSCLGWEETELFLQHDQDRPPRVLNEVDEVREPEFPARELAETAVGLCPTPMRWKWQDWALANGRENLHRVGGYPSWIQSAEYHDCPRCKQKMRFLLQLDSELPTRDGGEWLWGSGGILFALWCDNCKVSGTSWQCT
jgi:hypothetical protein